MSTDGPGTQATPAGSPAPAPWTVECDAVVWLSRAGEAARRVLPPALRGSRVVAVFGAVVRYRTTPVGAYDEVLGAVACWDAGRPSGTVVLMAVDSEASRLAGQVNWGLPKTLGTLDGSPGAGQVSAAGAPPDRWRVTVSQRAVGPAVPVHGRSTLRQVAGDVLLTSGLTGSGRMRPALVDVGVESHGPLADWLRPGRHLGGVLTGVRFTLEEPRTSWRGGPTAL